MIHATAQVSPKAILGKNIKIGSYSIIHDNVVIGDNTVIESFCEIGLDTPLAKNKQLIIDKDSVIRSHSVFYTGSVFGAELKTGHHVVVRENVIAGCSLQIGTFGDIQGDCSIGNHVKMNSNVNVSKSTQIGNFVWLFGYAVLTNDPSPPSHIQKGPIVEDYAIVGACSTILPGVRIGAHAVIGACSCVTKDVQPHMFVQGVPARKIAKAAYIPLADNSDRSAYPWPKHFKKGYPKEVLDLWEKEFQ